MQKTPGSHSAASNGSRSISSTLLGGLRDGDASSWNRLVRIMGPVFFSWCRQARLQPSDAADVVQQVFEAVATHLDDFERESPGSSFRGWTWTITHNKIRDFFRRARTQATAYGGTDANRRFHELVDEELSDSEPEPESARRLIAQGAMRTIRGDFSEATWQAFWRMAIDGESSAEIGADLGMTQDAVRRAKFRVLRRLREEVEGLL